jgi:predicted ester cyclase
MHRKPYSYQNPFIMTTQINTESLTSLSRKGTCLEFFSAYQDLDIDRMIDLCNPQGEVWFQPFGEAGKGTIGEFGRTLWLGLMACFPNLDNTVDSATTDGDTVVCKVSIFGTQQQDFAGIASKGLGFHSEHLFIFRFTLEDKIGSLAIHWDHDSFQRQLGS